MNNSEPKFLALLLYLVDVQEKGADLNLIATGQGFRLIKGYYSAIKCGRARSAQVNEVEIAFHPTNAGMKPRDIRVVEPHIGIRQPANFKAFADDGFRIDRTIFARNYERALLYGAHLFENFGRKTRWGIKRGAFASRIPFTVLFELAVAIIEQ